MQLTYKTESGRQGCLRTDNWEDSIDNTDVSKDVNTPSTSHADIDFLVYPDPPQSNTSKDDDASAEEENCKVCGKENMRKGKKDIWVNCEFESCTYWCHSICTGFVVKKESDLDKVKFYCPQHIKSFKKI
ncbi:uncharacterized protein LOC132760174 [Ruditapes philippinarum]|uniref:uncharacterized protein LOC132748637 n=1 Tax=Ruditapes philippinarum TaxID=129788 RepID=UPI00295A61F7|nr:uncharacterized protein LOC132748637 [Ruditapes philippinarum]XP_060608073.1 uncharacterized protein LOC132760174 [Ruditapes philippinarum]